jgi:hypothetical protein
VGESNENSGKIFRYPDAQHFRKPWRYEGFWSRLSRSGVGRSPERRRGSHSKSKVVAERSAESWLVRAVMLERIEKSFEKRRAIDAASQEYEVQHAS